MAALSNKEHNVQHKWIELHTINGEQKQTLIQTKKYHKNQMIVDIKLFDRGPKAIRKKIIALILTKLEKQKTHNI